MATKKVVGRNKRSALRHSCRDKFTDVPEFAWRVFHKCSGLYRDSMCTRSASACAPQCGQTAQCASLIAPYRACAIHTRSAAVQPTQFPCIEYVFRFVEGERFVPDGIFDVDVSVEAVSRALLFETEKQL